MRPEHRFSQIALLVIIALIIYRLFFSQRRIDFCLSMNPLATGLLLISGSAFLLNEYFISINILSAVCALIALYALLGFIIEQRSWNKGMIFMMLAILFLPFGDYLDVFLGFPLRLASAQAASDLLVALGFDPKNTQTLIELDNQLTYVDISCSGIRGLWSGLGFFVLLTWIEQKAISLYWWLVLVIFLLLIFTLNVLRVTAMVLIGDHLHLPLDMDMIHNSLGIIGFAFACMSGWLLLAPLKIQAEPEVGHQQTLCSIPAPAPTQQNIILPWLLVVAVIIFNLLYTPMHKRNVTMPRVNPEFSNNWYQQAIPLNAQEAKFYPRQGAYAQKFNFNYEQSVAGSMVLVNTLYWKAHHDPRNCFQAQGYNLLDDRSRRFVVNSSSGQGGPSKHTLLKQLELSREGKRYRAYYWFQSQNQQTDDFSQRLFSDLVSQVSKVAKPWTMVSLIVEHKSVSNSDNEQQLIHALSDLTSRWVETLSESQRTPKDGKNER
jgi:exosortase O